MLFSFLLNYLIFSFIITELKASKRHNNSKKNVVEAYLRNLRQKTIDHEDQEQFNHPSKRRGKRVSYEQEASISKKAFNLDINPHLTFDLNEPWPPKINYERASGESSTSNQNQQYTRDFLSNFEQASDADDRYQYANDAVQINEDLDPKNHKLIRIEGKSDNRKHCETHWVIHGKQKQVMTKCKDCDAFICPECQQVTHKLDYLPETPAFHTELIDEDQKCFYCNEQLGSNAELLVDHTNQCTMIPHDTVPFSIMRHSLYACYKSHDYCDFQTNFRIQMLDHVRSHTKEKPFFCEPCKKPFRSIKTLRRHNKSKHEK